MADDLDVGRHLAVVQRTGLCDTPSCCRRHPKACTAYTSGVQAMATASSTVPHRAIAASSDRDVSPPHVTYVAFRGKDNCALEVARSAFSLIQFSQAVLIHVLTDDDAMDAKLRQYGLMTATVQFVQRPSVLSHFEAFGLYKMAHHSGLGGYCKLLIAELLPPTVKATIVLDADTMVVDDIARLWALRQTLLGSPRRSVEGDGNGAVLAAKRLSTGGICLRGQRINSGVVLMNLQRMRERNWTSHLLRRISLLGVGHVPARACGKMVRNGSLAAGDQELLSFGCLKAHGNACLALPDGLHQDKCDGMTGGARALILHFVRAARLLEYGPGLLIIRPPCAGSRVQDPNAHAHTCFTICLTLLTPIACFLCARVLCVAELPCSHSARLPGRYSVCATSARVGSSEHSWS